MAEKANILDAIAALDHVLDSIGPLAVAVSGGVDSMTLAHAAHRRLNGKAIMYHALSPAVPPEASTRVERQAAREGWRLELINAGEYNDPDYLKNPVNRCFFCKNSLYGRIAGLTDKTIVSGTNLDDLGDYRPGLQAAERYSVRHPYVEAAIDKSTLRAMARVFGLNDIAELPAAPCLSSRIETGIPITATDLNFVHQVERMIETVLQPETVRCRVRRDGVEVQLDPASLARLTSSAGIELRQRIIQACRERGYDDKPVLAAYQRGSAFLRESS